MTTARALLPLFLVAPLLVPAPPAVAAKAKPAAAAPKSTPARAKVATVQDRRSSGSFARCTVGIELPDYPAHEVAAVRVVVATAVDDTGAVLVPDEPPAGLEPSQRGQMGKPDGDRPAPPALVFAELKNPSRTAKSLKELSGEIELFVPARDPNGAAKLPKFLSLAGKPVSNPALKANGVEISILTKAQVAAERKKAEEAERARLKKEGYDDAEAIASSVESALWSFPKGEDNEVVLRVKDPKGAIQEIKAFDGEGNRMFAGGSDEAGLRVLKFWGDPPKPDWSLVVELRTEKNLLRHTFAFRDLPLP